MFRSRVTRLHLDRERAQAAPNRVRARLVPSPMIPQGIVVRFGQVSRE